MHKKTCIQLVLDILLTILFMTSEEYFLAVVWLIYTVVSAVALGMDIEKGDK